jgi:type I restriction enzyme S subunit
MKDQDKFSEIFNGINQQKEMSKQSLQKSEELFQSLLQRAFKGELV